MAVLTLATAQCAGCARRFVTAAQVRRWPHLARYHRGELDGDGRCSACPAPPPEPPAPPPPVVPAQRRRRRGPAELIRERPDAAQRRAWAAADSRGPRGLRRTVVRGIVRWVEE